MLPRSFHPKLVERFDVRTSQAIVRLGLRRRPAEDSQPYHSLYFVPALAVWLVFTNLVTRPVLFQSCT